MSTPDNIPNETDDVEDNVVVNEDFSQDKIEEPDDSIPRDSKEQNENAQDPENVYQSQQVDVSDNVELSNTGLTPTSDNLETDNVGRTPHMNDEENVQEFEKVDENALDEVETPGMSEVHNDVDQDLTENAAGELPVDLENTEANVVNALDSAERTNVSDNQADNEQLMAVSDPTEPKDPITTIEQSVAINSSGIASSDKIQEELNTSFQEPTVAFNDILDTQDSSKNYSEGTSQPEPTSQEENSALETSSSGDIEKKVSVPTHCLNLKWSFGINTTIPTINMCNGERTSVVYACANVVILYDYLSNNQKLLQGHSNAITCMAASQDKRWLATADSGKNSSVIIWDIETLIPVQTLFDPHGDRGVVAMAMTLDAKYLATIGNEDNQVVKVWDWTSEVGVDAVASVSLRTSYGKQLYIFFDPVNSSQLVSNSTTQVVFYNWNGSSLTSNAPPLSDQDFNRVVGFFSQSIFVADSSWVYTATTTGNVVIWARFMQAKGPKASANSRKAFKLVKLQEKPIYVLTTHGRLIVTGDMSGTVKFYDTQLRMVNWYQEFHSIGPITTISFSYQADFEAINGIYPHDATIEAQKFVVRDFVLGTNTARLGLVTVDGSKLDIIHSEHDDGIYAIAANPAYGMLAIGSHSSLLKVWDYHKKEVVCSKVFSKTDKISCLRYDPTGQTLAIGNTNGLLYVVDGLTLRDELKKPFSMSHDGITHIAFSHNSSFLVTADKDMCVIVYKRIFDDANNSYCYLAKYRSHYKEIVSVEFGVSFDTAKSPRLFSLGKDRVLVEYDIVNCTEDDLQLLSKVKIEQSGVPLCLAWYPPMVKEDFLLISNDQYKLKLYNSTTKMCRKTVLGPTYGSPIERIIILPYANDPILEKRYAAFITKDKVGLHRLPVEGNPHDAMVIIAHPQGVHAVVSSFDGKYIFTAGGKDCSVHMWEIYIPALEASATLGGEDLIPFYGMLEGGRDGYLFKELENYFYYAMIRSQGVDTMNRREVSVSIPVSEIPFVMRALGFYPSEHEIENMMNEIKFSKYIDTKKYVERIDMREFIKLYVNHRPAFGMSQNAIVEAFRTLGYTTDSGLCAIERETLFNLLQNSGEEMNDTELADFIGVLLGLSPEGANSEVKGFNILNSEPDLYCKIPETITVNDFCSNILGFPVQLEPEKKIERSQSAHSSKTVRLVTAATQYA